MEDQGDQFTKWFFNRANELKSWLALLVFIFIVLHGWVVALVLCLVMACIPGDLKIGNCAAKLGELFKSGRS
jgi:hypothetical protein